jgi:hypothetical protein
VKEHDRQGRKRKPRNGRMKVLKAEFQRLGSMSLQRTMPMRGPPNSRTKRKHTGVTYF